MNRILGLLRQIYYRLVIDKGWIDIILICLVGLMSITWFDGNHLIAFSDFWFPADGSSYLSELTSTWIDTTGLGVSNFKGMAAVPYGIYLTVMDAIGLPDVASEMIFFYVIFVAAGLSMYYLTKVIGLARPWRILAAFFYMMNPASISYFATPFIFMAYSCAPLLLGLYINGLERRNDVKYILVFALGWSLIASFTYVDPGYLITHVAILFSYLIFYVITHRNVKLALQGIKFTAILFASFLLLNTFWLIPFLSGLQDELAKSSVVTFDSNEQVFRALSANFLNALRLIGYGGALITETKGELYFEWAPWYFQKPTMLISLLIPATALLSLLQRGVMRKYLYYFGFLLIGGLLLTTGAYPPFGDATSWFMKAIPNLLTVFRNPLKFQVLTALALAPLLGAGVAMIYKFLAGKGRG